MAKNIGTVETFAGRIIFIVIIITAIAIGMIKYRMF